MKPVEDLISLILPQNSNGNGILFAKLCENAPTKKWNGIRTRAQEWHFCLKKKDFQWNDFSLHSCTQIKRESLNVMAWWHCENWLLLHNFQQVASDSVVFNEFRAKGKAKYCVHFHQHLIFAVISSCPKASWSLKYSQLNCSWNIGKKSTPRKLRWY